MVTSRAFRSYGRPLEMVTSFKYPEIMILAADDDWLAVIRNLTKVRVVWRRIKRILSREGARQQVSVFFFKAVVQLVSVFGVETWLVNPHMGWVIEGFPGQGGAANDDAAPVAASRKKVGLQIVGGGENGDGV